MHSVLKITNSMLKHITAPDTTRLRAHRVGCRTQCVYRNFGAVKRLAPPHHCRVASCVGLRTGMHVVHGAQYVPIQHERSHKGLRVL